MITKKKKKTKNDQLFSFACMCFVCVIGIIGYVYLGGWMYKDNRRAQSEEEEKRERETKRNKEKQNKTKGTRSRTTM